MPSTGYAPSPSGYVLTCVARIRPLGCAISPAAQYAQLARLFRLPLNTAPLARLFRYRSIRRALRGYVLTCVARIRRPLRLRRFHRAIRLIFHWSDSSQKAIALKKRRKTRQNGLASRFQKSHGNDEAILIRIFRHRSSNAAQRVIAIEIRLRTRHDDQIGTEFDGLL